MKKAFSLLMALMLLLSVCVFAQAEEETQPVVYVTIANGELALCQEPVTVTDADGDGALTIADALYLAHEAAFDGGAEAGFAAETTEYGLTLTRLWGVENGGSYGYYVNNTAAMSLADPVADGDFINAFVYTDLTAWSDVYCFFDAETVAPGEVTLTLSAAGYDENWAPVTSPLAGAVITVNGEKTESVTDENGQVTLTVEAGDVISAVAEDATLVPPCCVAEDAQSDAA